MVVRARVTSGLLMNDEFSQNICWALLVAISAPVWLLPFSVMLRRPPNALGLTSGPPEPFHAHSVPLKFLMICEAFLSAPTSETPQPPEPAAEVQVRDDEIRYWSGQYTPPRPS